MARRIGIAAASLAVLLAALAGCAEKVLAPPRVSLQSWRTLGIVEFSGGAEPGLGVLATQEFMEALQAAQPGARILELGPESKVLAEVNSVGLDFEAIRAVGEHYGVDAVFVGRVELGSVKPNVQFGQAFSTMEARADLQGELSARLMETSSGATVWSRSTTGSANVAHLGVPGQGLPVFGASDPSDVRGNLVRQLVANATPDFYSHWVKKRK